MTCFLKNTIVTCYYGLTIPKYIALIFTDNAESYCSEPGLDYSLTMKYIKLLYINCYLSGKNVTFLLDTN